MSSVKTDIKFDCRCISADAKGNLEGALTTVIILTENEMSKLRDEMAEDRRRTGEIPEFKQMAHKHLNNSLSVAKELKAEILRIPSCRI